MVFFFSLWLKLSFLAFSSCQIYTEKLKTAYSQKYPQEHYRTKNKENGHANFKTLKIRDSQINY